jgi:hypothetical protein
VAVATVASLAPCGIEGFGYLAGMGELSAEDIKLFFSDPRRPAASFARTGRRLSRRPRSSSLRGRRASPRPWTLKT